MGTPYTCVWNAYTVRETEQAQQWLSAETFLQEVKNTSPLSEEAELALNLIRKPLPNSPSSRKRGTVRSSEPELAALPRGYTIGLPAADR